MAFDLLSHIHSVVQIEVLDIDMWKLNHWLDEGWHILSVVVLPEKQRGCVAAHYVLGNMRENQKLS